MLVVRNLSNVVCILMGRERNTARGQMENSPCTESAVKLLNARAGED